MFSINYNFYFFHFPYAAGHTIRYALSDQTDARIPVCSIENSFADQHIFPNHFRQFIGDELFNKLFKFCFVRNPWDLEVSKYEKARTYDNYTEPFEAWLAKSLKKDDQHVYLDLLDFIGRYERLTEDFSIICDKIGIENKIKWNPKFRDKRKPYHTFYTEETKNIVAKYYRTYIKLFGYKY